MGTYRLRIALATVNVAELPVRSSVPQHQFHFLLLHTASESASLNIFLEGRGE